MTLLSLIFWNMGLFSRTTDTEKKSVPSVPQDILNAVNVMSSATTRDDKLVRPATNSSFQSGASPFLPATPEKKEESVAQSPLPLEKKESIPETMPQEKKVPSSFDKKRMTIIALTVACTVVVGVLAWYFLKEKSIEVASPEPIVTEEVFVSPPVEPAVAFLPFVPDAPNYLSLDIETVTDQSLGVLLAEAGAKILEANMVQPVEFLLTDKNNNPLAFSRFAYLMNTDFSEEVLASFGESFSFFLYNDAGVMKTGLELSFVDSDKVEALVRTKEKSLPYSFRTVLFRGASVPRELAFRSGVYKDQLVRFVNIDTAQNISFDYAFREKHLFIGTSKDTLRAILDKN